LLEHSIIATAGLCSDSLTESQALFHRVVQLQQGSDGPTAGAGIDTCLEGIQDGVQPFDLHDDFSQPLLEGPSVSYRKSQRSVDPSDDAAGRFKLLLITAVA
jgi:hypothetical protein